MDAGERRRAETLEFLRELEPDARSARASASSTPPPATRSGSTCSRSSRPTPAWTSSRSGSALIGHSHVALFFTRLPRRRRRGDTQRRPGGATAPSSSSASGDWLLNPGSVGQPRDGDPRAAWLELDTESWTARFHRVAYDIDRAAAAIVAAGLPKRLAERLYVGQ